jgi:hypothetical protein
MDHSPTRATTTLTPGERRDIVAAAKDKGMNLATYLRYAALKLARRPDE